MKLIIKDHKEISSIKKEFTTLFPFLKFEFFYEAHNTMGASSKNSLIKTALTIGECRNVHTAGIITITPQMTVNDLEQIFQFTFGLSVQVFRKSGKVWLETTVTDGWTLEEQNRQGKELSTPIVD